MRSLSIFVDSVRLSLKYVLCALLPAVGGCISLGTPVRPLSKPIEAHFEMRHGLMLVEAVPSRPGSYFLFDTGSSFCLLDPAFFPDLQYDTVINLSFGFDDPAKKRVREVYPAPHINVGPFDIASYPGCEATDLKSLSQFTGVPVIGVLGAITYYNGTLQIDFSKNLIRVFPSDRKDHPEWGERRQTQSGGSALFSINGHNLPLVVDTGNNYFIAADSSLFLALRQTRDARETSEKGFTVYDGVSNRKRLDLKHLTIDGRTYSDSSIGAAPFTTSTFGTGFLKNFIVTLDCSRGYLYLKPVKLPATSTTAISLEN